MPDLKKKRDNLCSAYDRLCEAAEAYHRDTGNSIIRDGMIQRFEFTVELSWKTLKAVLEDQGVIGADTPKAAFREAYAANLIVNEEPWLLMLLDRNLTSHVYREDVATAIATRILNGYLDAFGGLIHTLAAHIN